jgi:DNA-binding XRE family transcriptional regulator
MEGAGNDHNRKIDRELGRVLARYRARAAMSQAEAARRLGVAQSCIAKIETGNRRALFREVVELAALYRVSLAELTSAAAASAERRVAAGPVGRQHGEAV